MAHLSEPTPIVFEDADSIFADLDQIINGASFPAASAAAERTESEADIAAPSQVEIAKAKAIFENCLPLNFRHLLNPYRRWLFLDAISILTSFSDYPSDKISALEWFQSEFPSLAHKFESSERELAEYKRLIDCRVSLAEILKTHATVYKTLKTKEELINEDIKKLEEQLKLKLDEKKNIIFKQQELAKSTQVKASTLAGYNSEAPSWMKKIRIAEDTLSRVISSWNDFKRKFL